MINKFKYAIMNNKKRLHKVGKNWVVVSALLLGALGLGGATVSASYVHLSNFHRPTENNIGLHSHYAQKGARDTHVENAGGGTVKNTHEPIDEGSPLHHGWFYYDFMNYSDSFDRNLGMSMNKHFDLYDIGYPHGKLAKNGLQDGVSRSVIRVVNPKSSIIVKYPKSVQYKYHDKKGNVKTKRLDTYVTINNLNEYKPWRSPNGRDVVFSRNLAHGIYANGYKSMNVYYDFSSNGKPVNINQAYMKFHQINGLSTYGGSRHDHQDASLNEENYTNHKFTWTHVPKHDRMAESIKALPNTGENEYYISRKDDPTQITEQWSNPLNDYAVGGAYGSRQQHVKDHSVVIKTTGDHFDIQDGSTLGYMSFDPSTNIKIKRRKPKPTPITKSTTNYNLKAPSAKNGNSTKGEDYTYTLSGTIPKHFTSGKSGSRSYKLDDQIPAEDSIKKSEKSHVTTTLPGVKPSVSGNDVSLNVTNSGVDELKKDAGRHFTVTIPVKANHAPITTHWHYIKNQAQVSEQIKNGKPIIKQSNKVYNRIRKPNTPVAPTPTPLRKSIVGPDTYDYSGYDGGYTHETLPKPDTPYSYKISGWLPRRQETSPYARTPIYETRYKTVSWPGFILNGHWYDGGSYTEPYRHFEGWRDINTDDNYKWHDDVPKQDTITGVSDNDGLGVSYSGNHVYFNQDYSQLNNHTKNGSRHFTVTIHVDPDKLPSDSQTKLTRWYKFDNKAYALDKVYGQSDNDIQSNKVWDRIRQRVWRSQSGDNHDGDGRLITDTDLQRADGYGPKFRLDTRINNYLWNKGTNGQSPEDIADDANNTQVHMRIYSGNTLMAGDDGSLAHLLSQEDKQPDNSDYLEWKSRLNTSALPKLQPGSKVPLHARVWTTDDNGINNGLDESLDSYVFISNQDVLKASDFHNGNNASITSPQRTLAYFGQSYGSNPKVHVEDEQLSAQQDHHNYDGKGDNATAISGYGLRSATSLEYRGWLSAHHYGRQGLTMDYGFPRALEDKNTSIKYHANPYTDSQTGSNGNDKADIADRLERVNRHWTGYGENRNTLAGLSHYNGLNRPALHSVNEDMDNNGYREHHSKGKYSTDYEFRPAEISRDNGTVHLLYDDDPMASDPDTPQQPLINAYTKGGEKIHRLFTPYFLPIGSYRNVTEKAVKNDALDNDSYIPKEAGSNGFGYETAQKVRVTGHKDVADQYPNDNDSANHTSLGNVQQNSGESLQPPLSFTQRIKYMGQNALTWLQRKF